MATTGPLAAGAFLLPEGQGQFVAGVGYSAGSRRFDQSGTAMPNANYRKAEASGYIEYGLTSWLSLIAAPTLSHANGSATNSVTGSDTSALGARLRICAAANAILALQALIEPPLGNESLASQLADGGARSLAADLRVMVGASFPVFSLPAFVDLEPGVRVRADPFPTEARLDLTFGLRPIPRLQILIQDFSAIAPAEGHSSRAWPTAKRRRALSTICRLRGPRRSAAFAPSPVVTRSVRPGRSARSGIGSEALEQHVVMLKRGSFPSPLRGGVGVGVVPCFFVDGEAPRDPHPYPSPQGGGEPRRTLRSQIILV